mmetsp:Transcript_112471/g.216652  ORF Transcript_112471/g.216652 Transcript_112471/m.216652 type:complete len:94 (+) Transcript_112471:568-849(+)
MENVAGHLYETDASRGARRSGHFRLVRVRLCSQRRTDRDAFSDNIAPATTFQRRHCLVWHAALKLNACTCNALALTFANRYTAIERQQAEVYV